MRPGWNVAVLAAIMAMACNDPSSSGSIDLRTPSAGVLRTPAEPGLSSAGAVQRDVATRWLECTDDVRSAMQAVLVPRFNMAIADGRRDGLTCVTIHFAHRPAFFVELVGERDRRRRRLHGVIAMDRSTALIALQEAKLDWAQLRGARVWFETVDLDGDGTDELVVHRGDDRYPTAEWIDLVAIRRSRLVELKGPGISYDDPDIGDSCRGTLTIENPGPAPLPPSPFPRPPSGTSKGRRGLPRVVGDFQGSSETSKGRRGLPRVTGGGTTPSRGRSEFERAGVARYLVVTTTASSGPSEHCLGPGRHVFALTGEQLNELSPLQNIAMPTDR